MSTEPPAGRETVMRATSELESEVPLLSLPPRVREKSKRRNEERGKREELTDDVEEDLISSVWLRHLKTS